MMVVMILESVPEGVRGELSRWLIEPHAGVFLGHVNALVRDRLWDLCCSACQEGGIIQMWSANNEQRFQMRIAGNTQRHIVDYEDIQLVRRPLPPSLKG
jgi:CRISPR-associated protein Cas2